ncbi:polysaccharide deacetylase family protein [Opitutus sp. ER46]|uniref:polysaccharide deacetylase family protein n=1 Tax=Opitutus sp. ER46 TaxID=2161864 RepID=UPI000D30A5A8|nr:polysaccharide deacetylase family protein [Opitutus sp. ER46]PTX91674.1 polysaccharide deacetylase [Opitutus sp. ER46]
MHFPAAFSVDVEQDCPPYLDTCRGMETGMPRLLDLLGELELKATFFTTGEMARRFPRVIERLVAEGHELGCHGDQHRDFTTLDQAAAEAELGAALATLRAFGPVESFRAPYLRFPVTFLPLLVCHGLRLDSSLARYKSGANHRAGPVPAGLVRVPASMTSSVLRLPRWIRAPWLARLRPPVVLFVHPWEAVDFRRSSLRWDCRFRTGVPALACWRSALLDLRAAGADFAPLRQFLSFRG